MTRLVLFVGLCLLTGFVGSMATQSSVDTWYATLNKPSWTPPNWLFAPVWTSLYLAMGVAAWLVWRRGPARISLTLFFGQLALNLAWSFLFFGMRWPLGGLIDIALLWIAIAATLWAFRTSSTAAAWLMVPYLAWVSYASALNFALWRMN